MAEKAEYCEKTNAAFSEYVKFADAKAGACLTFLTFLAGGLGYVAVPLLSAARDLYWVWLAIISLLVGSAFTLALVSALYCLSALQPRTTPADSSLNSFPDVAKMKIEEYLAKIAAITEAARVENLAKHNARLAQIAASKYAAISNCISYMRWAIVFSFLSLPAHAIVSVKGDKCPTESKSETSTKIEALTSPG